MEREGGLEMRGSRTYNAKTITTRIVKRRPPTRLPVRPLPFDHDVEPVGNYEDYQRKR